MFSDKISDYFEGVAAKYLSAVDANPERSNQHEIGGLPSVGFRQYLGSPTKEDQLIYKARPVYITDSEEPPTSCEDDLTWYDVRGKSPTRSPEYRLYYKSNPVIELINEGDFFLIAKRTDGSLLLVFCPPDTSVEAQLRAVFGLGEIEEKFSAGKIASASLILPLRLLLEELGLITAEREVETTNWLDTLLSQFGGKEFPVTSVFSTLARDSLTQDYDPIKDPDITLMAWMEHEEFLFRTYERYIVQQRLRQGFGPQGDDVDEFISYSLSVQNRRKSRVGHAFEGHLAALFSANSLQFERPRGKGKVTENNAKPDFLFPSFTAYHDSTFPSDRLIVLGAKTTCKDRWRQVLAEADRVERKYLITLEPAISVAQTNEMTASHLQLIVPESIQQTYLADQQSRIQTVKSFIHHAQHLVNSI